jgi:hypothetical protein
LAPRSSKDHFLATGRWPAGFRRKAEFVPRSIRRRARRDGLARLVAG